jgi:hypothetical protein
MTVLQADVYGEATAEFYELLATAHWAEFGPSLGRLLSGAKPSTGPVLDVGAGSGIGFEHIRNAVPGARIVAIEPSTAMRTALHTRLAMDDDLRERVTVLPCRFQDAVLPKRLCGAVASAVVGHFDDDERHALWRALGERLVRSGRAVVGVLPPTRPEHVPITRYRALPVGHQVYEGWMEAEPVDERRMRWTMTYRIYAGEEMVAERQASSVWTTYGADDIEREVTQYGLVVERPDDECVVLRQR